MTTDHPPPQAPESERIVLGSMLVDQQCLDYGRAHCEHNNFHVTDNCKIFDGLCRYPSENGNAVDLQRLADLIGDPDAPVLLADLCETICTLGNLPYHIGKLKDAAARRAAIARNAAETKRAFDMDVPFSVPTPAVWTADNTRPDWILQEPEPFKFIIPGLLAKGITGFIYGSGGTYKSLAALWLVLQRGTAQLIGGQKWLGNIPVPFGKSIFFSAEEVLLDLHHRTHNITPHLIGDRTDIPLSAVQAEIMQNCRFLSREMWVEDGTLFLFDENGQTSKVDKIIELVNSFGADLVILETSSRIFPLDENDNTAGARLVGVLEYIRDKTGATILVIDHSSKWNRSGKTDLQGQNSLRGASAKLDNSRFGLLMEPQKRDNGSDVLKITNSKSFRCRRADTFRVNIEYPVFTLLEESETKPDLNDQVVEIVRNNPGIKRRSLIEKLKGKGTAKSSAIKWCLTEEFIRKGDKGSGYYAVED